MQVRLILSYDIKPGKDQEYFEFLVRELAPGMARLGIQPTESWYTMYGTYPKIMTGGIAEDIQALKGILTSAEWKELRIKMTEFVTNFKYNVVRVSPFFPIIKS